MKKIIVTLSIILAGLSVQAFNWSDLGYSPYQQGYNNTTVTQPTTFSVVQPTNPTYNNMFYQDPNQVQCQIPNQNPYSYQRPYGYVNPYTARINPLLPSPYNMNTTSTSVPNQIVRNIGQSMLYSMMRGY